MKVKINQTELDSSFRVPASVIDRHIRLVNADQLKVLLWILRNNPDNPNLEEMCLDLNMHREDGQDYLQYWLDKGVLKEVEEEKAVEPCGNQNPLPEPKEVAHLQTIKNKAESASSQTVIDKNKSAEKFTVKYVQPSYQEVTQRMEQDPSIAALFREVGNKLGKLIGYNTYCVLLMLHDFCGLPIEVIFMLIDYCVSIHKTNDTYISAVGQNWGLQEIDTIEKAAEKIDTLNNANKIWATFAQTAGITNPRPTTAQSDYLSRWYKAYGFGSDMIYLAYEEMANHTQRMSFSYMDKVLTNWFQGGIKTPADVTAAKQKATSSTTSSGKTTSKKKETSYDISEFEKAAINTELRYERKKKE